MEEIIKYLPARFKFVKILENSTNSIIIRVSDKLTSKPYILKIIPPESIFYNDFFNEYVITKMYKHPNLATIVDTGFILNNNSLYYVMPYYKRTNPTLLCKKLGKKAFYEISAQLLQGLAFLHHHGIIHADISFDNIFVTYKDRNISVKISDFGLSSLLKMKKLSDISGTAQFVAPELIESLDKINPTEQSDIYSLGIFLKMILTGNPILQKKDPLLVLKEKLINKKKPIIPAFEIENDIIEIIEKLTEDKPLDRYKNLIEVINDVRDLFVKNNIEFSFDYYKNPKIEYRFFQQNLIEKISNNLKNKNIIYLTGLKKGKREHFADYLKAKLNFSLHYVIKLKNIERNKIEELLNLKKTYRTIVILLENPKNEEIPLEIINEIIKYDLKLIIFSEPLKIKSNFPLYKISKFPANDFDKYIKFFFGVNFNNKNLIKLIFEYCNYNFELIDDFISFLYKKNALTLHNLKWQFSPINNLHYNTILTKQYISILKNLDHKTSDFFTKISFWKQEFDIKEISDIFTIPTASVLSRLKTLQELGMISINNHKARINYKFVKNHLMKNSKEEFKIRIRIIKFLENKKNLSFEDKLFLLENYKKINDFSNFIEFAYNLFNSIKNENPKIKMLGEIVFENKDYLPDKQKSFSILLKYAKNLISTEKRLLTPVIFDYLKQIKKEIYNKNLLYEFLILEFRTLLIRKNYEEILSLKEEQKSFISELPQNYFIEVELCICEAYYFSGDIKRAIDTCEKIYPLIEKRKKDINQRISYYSTLAYFYLKIGKTEKSKEFYLKAIKLTEDKKEYNTLIILYSQFGNLLLKEFKYNDAEKYFKLAEKLVKLIKNNTYRPLILHGLGTINLEKGNFWKAFVYFKNANSMEEKRGLVTIPFPLAKALYSIGFYNQALNYSKKSLNTVLKLKKYLLVPNILALIYTLHIKMKQYNDAEKIFELLKKYENSKLITINLLPHYYRALYLIKNKSFEKAISEIKIIAGYKNPEKNPLTGILLYSLYLKFYFYKSDIKKSLNYVDKILKLLKSVNDNLVEAPVIYHFIYKVKKLAYEKNYITEDYKKYLKIAYRKIKNSKNDLPSNKMRRIFIQSPDVRAIISDYENEINLANKSDRNSILLDFLNSVTKIIANVTDKNKLFSKILEIAMSVTHTDRGILFIIDDNKNLLPKYSVGVDNTSMNELNDLNKKIIQDVISTKQPIYSTNVLSNAELDNYKTIVNLKVESIICLPLMVHKAILGSIYLDSKRLIALTPDETKFLKIFSQISASALETSEIYCKITNEKETLSKLLNRDKHKEIIGKSPQVTKVLEKIEKIAPTDVNVLIEGESGTGKELVAKDIYRLSRRKDKKFIPIDCGSLSETIIESELFGHSKGAFSGAISDKLGIFEEANGGTVFLDEISNLSLRLQGKLLRFIQEGEFKRVGENKIRKSNVRLIFASNESLKTLVETGRFRKDLFYRISVFPIFLPPLRERKEDIILLSEYFLAYFNRLHNKKIKAFNSKAEDILENYLWPGNIRQLKNEIERAIIICEDNVITEKEFSHLNTINLKARLEKIPLYGDFNSLIKNYKKLIIENSLKQNGNNWAKAAKTLGLSRQNLRQIYRRLQNN